LFSFILRVVLNVIKLIFHPGYVPWLTRFPFAGSILYNQSRGFLSKTSSELSLRDWLVGKLPTDVVHEGTG